MSLASTGLSSIKRKRYWKNTAKAWALFAPSLLFMTIFTFYPFVNTFVLSFYKKKLNTKVPIFNGLANYERAFKDPIFLRSVDNTIAFALVVIPLSLIIGLLLAYLLNKKTPGRTLFRAFIFYPNISPMVGFFLVWMYLMAKDIGYINRLLYAGFGVPPTDWLGDPKMVLISLEIIYLWRQGGYMMLFYLSGLQGIDNAYYEAATLDGANEWQKFWKITFPLLMPTTVYTLMLSITGSVQLIDPIAILTEGGPNNASTMVMYYIYQNAFSRFDYGMASTYSVLLLIVLLTIICIQQFGMDKLTHYES